MTFDNQGVHEITPHHPTPEARAIPGAVLLDYLLKTTGVKNDARLGKLLQLSPPVISKVRSGKLNVSDGFILRVHETLDIPVRQIRAILASN